MGFRQALHRLFTGYPQEEINADAVVRLARMVKALGDEQEQLRADLDALKISHRQFMGRVSAWKKWDKLSDVPPEPPTEAPAPTNPFDPRLSKAQARAALMAQGKLRPSVNPADLKPPN